MQTKLKRFQISVSKFQTFSWPVKIRVRASSPTKAPRKPLIVPASLVFKSQTKLVMRTIEAPNKRPCHALLAVPELQLWDEPRGRTSR